MTKTLALLCLLAYKAAAISSAGSTAAIGLNEAQPSTQFCIENPKADRCWKNLVNPEKYNENKNSANYEPNTNYQTCSCDKTTMTCDAFCCCDNDCAFNTKQVWLDNKQCSNIKNTQSTGMPLQSCLSRAEVQEYNSRNGISNYVDPFAQLFCVYFDRSPEMGEYYDIPGDKQITNAEIENLRRERKGASGAGFENAIRQSEDQKNEQDNYSMGDLMKASISLSAAPTGPNTVTKTYVSQNSNAFTFPTADLYGSCNNFYSPRFMENASSKCTQNVNAAEQCLSTLNPKFYSDQLEIWVGTKQKSSKNIKVEVEELFTYNQTSMKYTLKSSRKETPSAVVGGKPTIQPVQVQASAVSGCSCNNAVYEVAYTVNVTPAPVVEGTETKEPFFTIDSVKARVATYSTAVGGGSPTTGGQCAPALVPQKFSIEFISSGGKETIGRSGNPGYIESLPVLVGQAQAKNALGPKNVYKDGFTVSGADQYGNCLMSSDPSTDYGDPALRFGQNMNYSCKYKDLTRQELDRVCKSPSGVSFPANSYQIFKNLDFFQFFGQFGNANYYVHDDWTEVTQDTAKTFEMLGKRNPNSTKCEVYSNANFVIMYAEMGFKENAKKYIVKVQKSSTPEEWKFNRKDTKSSSKQAFSLNVSFQFIKVDLSDAQKVNRLEKARNKAFEAYNNDLFYPFTVRTQSYAAQLVATMCGAVSVSMLLL